jgi:hypothetical protein
MKKIIQSEIYKNAIKEIVKIANIRVDSDYDEVLESYGSNSLSKANVMLSDIIGLLESDYLKVINFSIGKLAKFHNVKIVEEYPNNEEVEDESNKEVFGNYVISFLFKYLIEYYLLKNNQEKLIEYLKSIRIPHAKQYEKELKRIYKEI